MCITIEIPDTDIPHNQGILDIPLQFMDGKLCCAGGYGFKEVEDE